MRLLRTGRLLLLLQPVVTLDLLAVVALHLDRGDLKLPELVQLARLLCVGGDLIMIMMMILMMIMMMILMMIMIIRMIAILLLVLLLVLAFLVRFQGSRLLRF